MVADGTDAVFVRGDSIPVPRRSVSDQGTVTTTQFDFVQTGLEAKAGIRELAAGRARLTVDVRLSSLRDFVEGAPVTSDESFAAAAIVESGGVYLVGSLRREEESVSSVAGIGLGWLQKRDTALLQVWCRAYRVAGPVDGRPPKAAQEAVGGPAEEYVFPGPHEVTHGVR